MTAAHWSAVAATFSALSSLLIMMIQRRNLLESARPELVLGGFDRVVHPNGSDLIVFREIKNVGRGPALHLHFESFGTVDNRPTFVMASARLPIVAANETIPLNAQIHLWWENVPEKDGSQQLFVPITITCWDSRDFRHKTRYQLFAVALSPNKAHVMDSIAPGVMLAMRTTTTRAGWMLQASNKISTIPWLGRLFRDRSDDSPQKRDTTTPPPQPKP
jgi:hypothetical protein